MKLSALPNVVSVFWSWGGDEWKQRSWHSL